DAAARLALVLDAEGHVRVEGGDPLDEVVATALAAVLDGSWRRLKACRNCHWSFYDYSPNLSATWCSMQLCGNRKKTRAYRARTRAAYPPASARPRRRLCARVHRGLQRVERRRSRRPGVGRLRRRPCGGRAVHDGPLRHARRPADPDGTAVRPDRRAT